MVVALLVVVGLRFVRIPLYKKIMIAIQEGMDSLSHDIEAEAVGPRPYCTEFNDNNIRQQGGTKAGGSAAGPMSILASYEQRHMDNAAVREERKKANEVGGGFPVMSCHRLDYSVDNDCVFADGMEESRSRLQQGQSAAGG